MTYLTTKRTRQLQKGEPLVSPLKKKPKLLLAAHSPPTNHLYRFTHSKATTLTPIPITTTTTTTTTLTKKTMDNNMDKQVFYLLINDVVKNQIIIDCITSFLPYCDLVSLCMTSRHLYTLLSEHGDEFHFHYLKRLLFKKHVTSFLSEYFTQHVLLHNTTKNTKNNKTIKQETKKKNKKQRSLMNISFDDITASLSDSDEDDDEVARLTSQSDDEDDDDDVIDDEEDDAEEEEVNGGQIEEIDGLSSILADVSRRNFHMQAIHKMQVFIAGKCDSMQALHSIRQHCSYPNHVFSRIMSWYHSLIHSGSIRTIAVYDDSWILHQPASVATQQQSLSDRTVTLEIFPLKWFPHVNQQTLASNMREREEQRVLLTIISKKLPCDSSKVVVAYLETRSTKVASELGISVSERTCAFEIYPTKTNMECHVYPVLKNLNSLMMLGESDISTWIELLLWYSGVQCKLDICTFIYELFDEELGEKDIITPIQDDTEMDVRTSNFESKFNQFVADYAYDSLWLDSELVSYVFSMLNRMYCKKAYEFPFPSVEPPTENLLEAVSFGVSQKAGYGVYANGAFHLQSSFHYSFGACRLIFYVSYDLVQYEIMMRVLDRSTSLIMFGDTKHIGIHHLVKRKCSEQPTQTDQTMFDALCRIFPITKTVEFFYAAIVWLACAVEIRYVPRSHLAIRLADETLNLTSVLDLRKGISQIVQSGILEE